MKKLLTIVVACLAFPAAAAADDWWLLDYSVLNDADRKATEACQAVPNPDLYIQTNFGYNYSRVDHGDGRQYILLTESPQLVAFTPSRRSCLELAYQIIKERIVARAEYLKNSGY